VLKGNYFHLFARTKLFPGAAICLRGFVGWAEEDARFDLVESSEREPFSRRKESGGNAGPAQVLGAFIAALFRKKPNLLCPLYTLDAHRVP
jgi:hypothetical protein